MTNIEDYYSDPSLWNDFYPLYSLDYEPNNNFLQRLSEIIFNKIFPKSSEKRHEIVFSTLTVWDFQKKELPQFHFLFVTDSKFIPQFTDKIDWSKLQYYRPYVEFLELEKKTNNNTELHFWDILHKYKKFCTPIKIYEDRNDIKIKILDTNKSNISLEEFIQDNWIWDAFRDDKHFSHLSYKVKDRFKTTIKAYFNKLKPVDENSFTIYEIPLFLNVERFKENIWFRSVGSLTIGLKQPDDEYVKGLISVQIKDIITAIVTKQYQSFAISNAQRSAIAAIMSRNMSHNLGSHVLSGTKAEISKTNFQGLGEPLIERVRGTYRLFQYLQERMDFIALIINHEPQNKDFYAPLNLKADILDEFAVDGRGKRHDSLNEKTHSYLLDHIVSSERIVRNANNSENLEVEIQLLKKEKYFENEKEIIKIKCFTSLKNGDNDSNEFNDINLSIPLGVNSRHALLTILENFIRNIAKHKTMAINNIIQKNKKHEEKEKIIISLMVEEEDENYILTMFDNLHEDYNKIIKLNHKINNIQNLESTIDEGRDSIKIVNNDGSLNRYNKGLKEMLVCSAWLKGKTDDWSLLEKENSGLLNYVPITVEISQKVNYKGNREYISVEKIEDDSKNRQNIYTGIRLELPKHKYYHYSKIKSFEDILSLPSADIYVIETDDFELKNKATKALCKVLFFNELELDVRNKITNNHHNNKDTAKLLYNHLFKERFKDDRIIISYQSNIKEIDPEVADKVYRINESVEVSDYISKLINLPVDSRAHLFVTHNDSPSIFVKNITTINSNDLQTKVCYLEGISGGNFTYNLLCNAPIDLVHYYRIIEADNAKIAIIDERIYKRFRELKFEQSSLLESFTEQEIKSLEQSLFKYKEDNDINNLLESNDNLFQRFFKYLSIYTSEAQDKWLIENDRINIESQESYNKIWLSKKNIFLYNILLSDVTDKKTASHDTISQETNFKLVDIEGSDCKCFPEVDFLSIHYGIVEKLGLINHSDKKTFKKFLEDIFGLNLDKAKVSIHSGRGGLIEWQNEITFIPVSSIDAQMDDSKFKLAQMFLNQKYKLF